MDEAHVREVLNTITDPCSVVAGVRAGLDDMGLVREVQVDHHDDGVHITVSIGVTDPGCLMIYPFANEAQSRLDELDGVSRVDVHLDVSPDWHPDRMSEAYRVRLAAHRRAQGAMRNEPSNEDRLS